MRVTNKPIKGIYVEQYERDQTFRMPDSHLHPYYELFYLNRGACTFFVNNHFYELNAGSVVLIPPDTLHSTKYKSKKKALRSALFFRLEDLQFPDPHMTEVTKEKLSSSYVLEIPEMYRPHIEKIIEKVFPCFGINIFFCIEHYHCSHKYIKECQRQHCKQNCALFFYNRKNYL